jgi:hypothetical protein
LAAIEQAESDDLREQLVKRLVRVRTFAALSRAEQARDRFERRFLRRPLSMGELVFHGLLPAIPADPSGGLIELDLRTGEVRSTLAGPRKPLRAN